MDYERDVLDVKSHNEDEENQLRPQSFDEYVGQSHFISNLQFLFIKFLQQHCPNEAFHL